MTLLDKIVLDHQIAFKQVSEWKDKGEVIVFTNGCFDILHSGHVLYLEEAANQGTKLVVALNSDASVRRLKGKERPINDVQSRMTVIAALASVDMVISFEEDTPYHLIKESVPHVLVKGGDWPVEKIIGHDIVLASGGKVLSLTFQDGFSTTAIVEKMKKL